MADDAKLLARGKAILKELRLRRPTLLQSWMAQYIAECTEGLETAEPDERLALADRCAATITRLWEMQLQSQTNTLKRGVNYMLRRTELNDEALSGLRTVLDEAGTTTPGGSETKVAIWQLSDLERLVIEVFWAASERRKRKKSDADDDALADLRDRASTEAQKTVAAVFHNLGTTSLDDFDAVERAVNDALRAIDRVRRRLIWGEADAVAGAHELQ